MDCTLDLNPAGGANENNKCMFGDPQNYDKENIIINPDFSLGLDSWQTTHSYGLPQPNKRCEARVISKQHGNQNQIANNKDRYVVVTKRTFDAGLEQDITGKVYPRHIYDVSAIVKVGEAFKGLTSITAMVRAVYEERNIKIFVGRVAACSEKWVTLNGSFSIPRKARRVIFFLYGAPPNVDLQIKLVKILGPTFSRPEEGTSGNLRNAQKGNVIDNHDFSEGLSSWTPHGCEGRLISGRRDINDCTDCYVVLTRRTESWQGLEQSITNKVYPNYDYFLSATVRVGGYLKLPTVIKATIRVHLDECHFDTDYVTVVSMDVSDAEWKKLEGSFSLSRVGLQVILYLEGPPRDTDLLVKDVKLFSSSIYQHEVGEGFKDFTQGVVQLQIGGANENNKCMLGDPQNYYKENIIINPDFSLGLDSWRTTHSYGPPQPNKRCEARVICKQHGNQNQIANNKDRYVVVTKRTFDAGLEQDITGKVYPGHVFHVSAIVKVGEAIKGLTTITAMVSAHYGKKNIDIFVGRVVTSSQEWVTLKGSFSIPPEARRVIFYLNGAPPNVDLLINLVKILGPTFCRLEEGTGRNLRNAQNGNVIDNHDFSEGLSSWIPHGCEGRLISGRHEINDCTDCCVVLTRRTNTWQGLEQCITNKVYPNYDYFLSATVRVGGYLKLPTVIRATIRVHHDEGHFNTDYITVARVDVSNSEWKKLEGSFCLSRVGAQVILYFEGPPPNLDIIVNNVKLFSTGAY